MKCLVDKDNISKLIDDNFTGTSIQDKSINDIANEIINLEEKNIDKIIKNNYNVAKQKLDINKQIFVLKNNVFKDYDYSLVIPDLLNITEIIANKQFESQKNADELWKSLLELKSKTIRGRISKVIKRN